MPQWIDGWCIAQSPDRRPCNYIRWQNRWRCKANAENSTSPEVPSKAVAGVCFCRRCASAHNKLHVNKFKIKFGTADVHFRLNTFRISGAISGYRTFRYCLAYRPWFRDSFMPCRAQLPNGSTENAFLNGQSADELSSRMHSGNCQVNECVCQMDAATLHATNAQMIVVCIVFGARVAHHGNH